MKYVRLNSGVIDFMTSQPHPECLTEAPDYVGVGWSEPLTEGGLWRKPRSAIIARIAERRYDEEIKGVSVTLPDLRVMMMDTTRSNRSNMANFYATMLTRYPEIVTPWKMMDGFQLISKEDIEAITDQTVYYVQQCFNREAELLTILSTTSEEDLEAFEATVETFWPE